MTNVYEVRAESTDGKVHSFGARRSRAEAEDLLQASVERVNTVGGRNNRYWIEEVDTTGLFEIPSQPTPRERYTTRVKVISRPNVWNTVQVEVLDGDSVVASYDRNYEMLQTFEPFRQGDRMYALVSPHYTATSVLDLHTGTVIASEGPDERGFCPAGFYVPDWWDVHNGHTIPGSMNWSPGTHEWPTGDFGFVWGCHWGDDLSWKVQYLDLSAVRDGVIRRDDRFGYVELATSAKLEPREFIRCYSSDGRRRVEFHVRAVHDVPTGVHIPPEDPWS